MNTCCGVLLHNAGQLLGERQGGTGPPTHTDTHLEKSHGSLASWLSFIWLLNWVLLYIHSERVISGTVKKNPYRFVHFLHFNCFFSPLSKMYSLVLRTVCSWGYEMVFVCFLVLNRNSVDRKISRRILMLFLHSFVMCVSHRIMFALKFGETQPAAHN